MNLLDSFREVWLIDFEFSAPDGEHPTPICLVAREYFSGQLVRVWQDEFQSSPPWLNCEDVLIVAFYSSAEFGCFIQLGWPLPVRVLDLYCEFRNLTNGLTIPYGSGLLGALLSFGLDALNSAEKEEMRQLAMRGGPYTESERQSLLDYCQSDVDSLARLLPAMLPQIDLPRAMFRGRYMCAVARMEATGISVDIEMLGQIQRNWEPIKSRLIDKINVDYGVYTHSSFSSALFEHWLSTNSIPWPRLESGALSLSEDTFRQMAKQYPSVAPLRELRHTLGELRLNQLAIGSDGRNRTLLSPFRARTSRNQPSNSRFIFGPSCWLRALIVPPAGRALAYIDWSAQEIGIAAKLSGDTEMQHAYLSGDPYLWLGKVGGVIPDDATKKTHSELRDVFKVVYLAANYGMGDESLAELIGQPKAEARELLRMHREQFRRFWAWSDACVDHGMLHGWLQTVFGWRIQVTQLTKPTSLRNFPVQANGAEMLRLACCLATERGINVCAPVHDALLVEGPEDEIDDVVRSTQLAMREASEIVLDGFPLRSDLKIVKSGERYMDPRGERMWETVNQLLQEMETEVVYPE